MFCGPGSGWSGWYLGGWFMPGFFMLALVAVILWLVFRRATPSVEHGHGCPSCSGAVHASYFRCPHCGESLKHHCSNCSRVMDYDWSYCPYCNENQAAAAETGSPSV